MFRKIVTTLAVITLLVSMVNASPSTWALEEITRAETLNIVPAELRTDYQEPITRGEFTHVVLQFLAVQYNYDNAAAFTDDIPHFNADGARIDYYAPVPFQDLVVEDHVDDNRSHIHRAYCLGLVNGRGDGTFGPNDNITRQEAAVLFARAYAFYGGTPRESIVALAFADADSIADWARTSVTEMVSLNVMQGVEGNLFQPNGFYTREQCYLTFLRLYENAPTSRATGTIVPLRSYEDEIRWVLVDGRNPTEDYEVIYQTETDKCTVIYARHQVMMSFALDISIIYRAGGRHKVSMPIDWVLDDDSFRLSEDKLFLYFSDSAGNNYQLNLDTAKVSPWEDKGMIHSAS